jgi:hypothetical protein
MYVPKTFEESDSPGECAFFLGKALEQCELLQHHRRNLRRHRRNRTGHQPDIDSNSDSESADDTEATSDEESLGVRRQEQAKAVLKSECESSSPNINEKKNVGQKRMIIC